MAGDAAGGPRREAVPDLSRATVGQARAEDELRQSLARLPASEELFRSLVENTSDIIHVVDSDRVIQYVSPAVERLLGYRPEELIGTVGSDLLHPADREVAAKVVGEIMNDGPVDGRGALQRLRHRDGSWRTFEVSGARIRDADGRPNLVAISRDVTERERLAAERRELEAQLREAQKLEAVGRLAGGIAHDFNNLLTAIDGHAQLLLDGIDPADPMHDDLLEIHRSAERAARLTRQLLAFSRKQVLRPAVLDLGDVVERLKVVIARLVGDAVELRTVLAPDRGRVEADPHQMEEVLLQLAANARDAMPDGGRLTITAANVELDAPAAREFSPPLPEGTYLSVAVSDTGAGMDAETQARIFEPFFTTRAVGKGTGLGLSTVYGIVKQSGGEIAVESGPGRGATFTIYLPCVEDSAAAQQGEVAGGD